MPILTGPQSSNTPEKRVPSSVSQSLGDAKAVSVEGIVSGRAMLNPLERRRLKKYLGTDNSSFSDDDNLDYNCLRARYTGHMSRESAEEYMELYGQVQRVGGLHNADEATVTRMEEFGRLLVASKQTPITAASIS